MSILCRGLLILVFLALSGLHDTWRSNDADIQGSHIVHCPKTTFTDGLPVSEIVFYATQAHMLCP